MMRKLIFATLMTFSFVALAVAQDDLTTFILIRHAEKADDGTNNPGLTTEGEDRAKRLAALLSQTDVGAIYSTPFKRTLNTVAPLAADKGLDVEEYNWRNRQFVSDMFDKYKGKVIVVSGHSNTTPAVVNILLGTKEHKSLDESVYGNIYVVTISSLGKGTLTLMTY